MRKGLPGGLGEIKAPRERNWLRPKRPLPTAADQQRALWDTQVRQGKLSPEDAERLAAEAGQPPFARVEERYRLAVRESLWPLTMAILWVAWEDMDRVAQAWAEFQFWRGHLWSYPSKEGQKRSLEEAEHLAFEALRSGNWKATALVGGGRSVIEAHDWINIKWKAAHSRAALVTPRGAIYEDVRVDCAFVIERPSDQSGKEENSIHSISEAAPKNKGGGLQKYKWELMWIEVLRIYKDDGIDSRTELHEKLVDWFAAKNEHPSDSLIRDRMSLLFKTLGWKEER